MSKIAQVLKSEIARIARQTMRAEVVQLKKSAARYRGEIAALKRQVGELRQQVKQPGKSPKPSASNVATPETKVRFSPAKLKKHRERLGLSAADFGKLFGVSGQTVYNWEGGTRPSQSYLVMISQLRNLTKTQAHVVVTARS